MLVLVWHQGSGAAVVSGTAVASVCTIDGKCLHWQEKLRLVLLSRLRG